MADELFDVKNSFYLGHYQQTIQVAQEFKGKTPDAETEAKMFMYRAYIAQAKFNVVLNEINPSSTASLRAVRLYAQFKQKPSPTNPAVVQMEALLEDPILGISPTTLHFAGMMYADIGSVETAMEVVARGNSLECIGLLIQLLLQYDRVDVAQKYLAKMSKIDDDSSLTQLATAWVDLALGAEKYQDAFYIYNELAAKYGASIMLLVGQAACLIHQHKYGEAEGLLQDALDKDSNNAEALVCMITIAQQTGKSDEVSSRYISQLKDIAPGHPFVKYYNTKQDQFDRVSAQYTVSA
eukprot:CFRG3739T1